VTQNLVRWFFVFILVGCLVGLPFLPSNPPKVVAANVPLDSVRIPLIDLDPACKQSSDALQSELSGIAGMIDGATGIAVRRVGCSWVAGKNLDRFFPQQSVSKLWVTLTALDTIDRQAATLNEVLPITKADLTLFHQPLRARVLENGTVRLPIRELITDAITHSDNTANDRLLTRVGGPDAIRKMFREKGLGGIRFGPGERLLQSGIAGLTWKPEFSLGSNFHDARNKLPIAARQTALSAYLADPMDGATPSGITQALALLAGGQLLSPETSDFAMATLAQTKSGPKRLKAGAPADWKVYHKTGTGQILGPVSTGYNDVGILEAPDGARYAVAVMIAKTRSAIPARMEMMQAVSAAVAKHHARTTPPVGSTTIAAH